MLEYNASEEYMEDDYDVDVDDGPGRAPMTLEDLVSIMQDACSLLRRAKEERVEDFDILLEQVDDLVRRAISGQLEMGATEITSFAHAPYSLVQDPWYDRMCHESSKAE